MSDRRRIDILEKKLVETNNQLSHVMKAMATMAIAVGKLTTKKPAKKKKTK